MGAAGSDAAIETADIALMTDDLAKLPWLIDHSRRTLAIIRENIAFSLAVKALFVALTFAGYATLWGAIAADVGASLLVVMNALRLLRGESLWLRERVAQLHAIGLTAPRLKVGALAALALLYLASGLFTVQPGEVGVRQRFGAIVASDLAPGLHYRLPWPFESHRIVEADLVRRVEFGFRSEPAAELGPRALARDRLTVGGPGNPVPNAIKATGLWFEQQSVPEEAFLLAGDGNLIDLRFSVQYRVQDPVAFAYRVAEPEALVRSLTLAALRGIVATSSIDAVYTTERGAIEQRVREQVQAHLDDYRRRHRAAVRQPALRAPAAGGARRLSRRRERAGGQAPDDQPRQHVRGRGGQSGRGRGRGAHRGGARLQGGAHPARRGRRRGLRPQDRRLPPGARADPLPPAARDARGGDAGRAEVHPARRR